MLKHFGFILVFVLAGAVWADSISLGSHGSLQISVPDGWQLCLKDIGKIGLCAALSPKSDINAKCLITIIYLPSPKPVDKEQLKRDFITACNQFVSGSVEQKINPKDLKLSEGYGLCATFTDASLAGKASKVGDYKVLTSAKMQFSEDVFAIVSIFTDDENSVEQKQLMSSIEGLKFERAR